MNKALFKATSLVSLMTFISRVLGFARDVIVAQVFGVNASVDAFTAAFKIPNFMRALFAEGCFSQAFVPVLSQYRHTRQLSEIKQFISYVSGSLGSLLIVIVMIGIIISPGLIKLFAPGFGTYRSHLAIEMLRVTFPYLFFISLTAFIGSILNAYNLFAVPALTPALLNICLILAALYLSPYFSVPIESQAWGVLFAGFIQLLFLFPFLYRLGFFVSPQLNWSDTGVQHVLRLMLPALFGASIGQIGLLLNTVFASFLSVGSVTWLYFSDRLTFFPLGIFGVALATVVLPQLASHYTRKSKKKFEQTLDWGIRCNLLIGLPATITMSILSGQLTTSLFQYGKFTVHDVLMTQRSVIAYAVGLAAFMLVKILSSAFYAQQDIKTPVKISMIVLVLNVLLNVSLIIPLKHTGLALASSLAAWFNVVLLIQRLYCLNIFRFQPGWLVFILRLLLANLVLAAFLFWTAENLSIWLAWGWKERFLHLFILGLASVFIYLISLFTSGIRLKHLKIS